MPGLVKIGFSIGARDRDRRSMAAVLVVGHVVSPLRLGTLILRYALGHGEVGHEMVRCGAVPVPLVRGCVDNVPRPDLDDIAATDCTVRFLR